MRTLRQDIGFGLRQLAKNRAFAATAILSLAMGIGATTAVFSVVYAVLMNPYPYRNPDRLTYLVLRDKAGNDRWPSFSASQLSELRRLQCIESVLPMQDWSLTTTDGELPEDVSANYLTSNFEAHLGVPAMLGRSLIESDALPGHDPEPVLVLSYKFWQRYYGGRPDVIGQTLRLVHKPYAVVGVMPPRFTWGDADVYIPLNASEARDYFPSLRLKPGISYETTNAELQSAVDRFSKDRPARFPTTFRVHIQGLNEWINRNLGGSLKLLFAAVAVMLLIGCVNVSILLLARGTARQQEIAIRASIGADRGRIIRQLLTEALILALGGMAAGVLLAHELVTLILGWVPERLFPTEAEIHVNLPVLLFSIAIALFTGILFGLWPALHLSHQDLAQVIQTASRRNTGGARVKRTHAVLVATQVALTLILLSGAGEAVAAFRKLMQAELGYDPHHTMSVGIPVHDNTHMRWEDRVQYFDEIRAKVAALPGVVDAGISTNATPPYNGQNTLFEIFGGAALEEHQARTNFVSPEYFSVLHIPLAEGRLFTHAETIRGARLALVNQTLARQYWPNGSAVGQQIRIAQLKADPPYNPGVPGSEGWLQIVGVVTDAKDDGLRKPIQPAVYVPYSVALRMWTQILVRAQGDPLALTTAIRRQLHSVDMDQQIEGHPRDLEQWIARTPEWASGRLVTILLSGFSFLALALALFGLYSVVSHMVARRTNEFGLRMALGAEQRDIFHLVLTSTSKTVGAGMLLGASASFVASRLMGAWLQESKLDPLILGVALVLVAIASVAACLAPAWRAATLDPMGALRYE